MSVLTSSSSSKPFIFNKSTINLQAYLERIGYKGTIEPTFDVFAKLHRHHVQEIPFENLNPFLRLPVKLDIDSIQNKFINDRRGGYCFEHNTLLNHALREIGFSVRGLSARVLWNLPEGVVPARGHMLLLVTVGYERFIADVGFGGLTLPEPLRFASGVEQQTSHEIYRILEVADEYLLQANLKNEWKSLYRFTIQENLPPDYEVVNYYLSTNENSHFMHNVIAARVAPGKRFALRNNELTIHTIGEDSTRIRIESAIELKDILDNMFGISLPAKNNSDERLAAIFKHE